MGKAWLWLCLGKPWIDRLNQLEKLESQAGEQLERITRDTARNCGITAPSTLQPEMFWHRGWNTNREPLDSSSIKNLRAAPAENSLSFHPSESQWNSWAGGRKGNGRKHSRSLVCGFIPALLEHEAAPLHPLLTTCWDQNNEGAESPEAGRGWMHPNRANSPKGVLPSTLGWRQAVSHWGLQLPQPSQPRGGTSSSPAEKIFLCGNRCRVHETGAF